MAAGRDTIRFAIPDTRDLTLLVITPDFPDKFNRYIGSIYVKDQVNNLKPYFNKIVVICPVLFSCKVMPNDRYCTDYQYDNVTVYYPRCFFVPRLIPGIPYKWKLGWDTRPHVVRNCIEKNRIKFDLIHAQFTWPSAYCAAILKEQFHVPYVITPHEDPGWLKEEIDLMDARLERAWKDADCITYMNSLEVPKLIKYNPNAISVPNGFHPMYHPRNRQECRVALNLAPDAKILFTFGNLQKRKGLEYLIGAVDILTRQGASLQCYIGGKAEYEKSYEAFLKKLVTDLHLEDQVHFIGFLDTGDIPVWLNACDLFVLPSLEEGFGIAQIEALACGRPVIAAKNSGSLDILTDPDVGVLCERADSEDFARGIQQGLSRNWNPEKIVAFAGKYRGENVILRVVDIYNRILKEKNPAS